MKKRVLIFPCGSEVGLEIYRSLRYSKDFEIYGASSVHDHGEFVYENYISNVPFVDHKDFISGINKIIRENEIDFIFPAHDSVVLKLAQNINRLNAIVITSPSNTCELARSKRQTYLKLKEVIKVPQMYDYAFDDIKYPVFLKPDVGQGSKGTCKANSPQEVEVALSKDSSLLILEYLPGKEYTVDCFTDMNGKLLFSQARERLRVINGISVRSKPVKDPEFINLAFKLNEEVAFRGVWFFQVKRNAKGELLLMEIAPRVAGTMALCRMRGVNLPLLSLYDAQDIDVSVIDNGFSVEIDRALASRYKVDIKFSTVYVDLDDTIIIENKLNYKLISLLYKFISQGKKTVLITKHSLDVKLTLAKHKLSIDIFDEIITLTHEQSKADHMNTDGIFIDDSFSERKFVQENLGIPVFDVSEAVELL